MSEVLVDYDEDLPSTEDIFFSHEDFCRLQRLKRVCDVMDPHPSDLFLGVDHKEKHHSQSPGLTKVGGSTCELLNGGCNPISPILDGGNVSPRAEALKRRDSNRALSPGVSAVNGKGGDSLSSPHTQKPSAVKKIQCWKPCKLKRRMVVGEDVGIGDIAALIGRALVGRFCGKVVSLLSLKEWLDENWFPLLDYSPTFHTLAQGWLCVIFKMHAKLQEVLKQSCRRC